MIASIFHDMEIGIKGVKSQTWLGSNTVDNSQLKSLNGENA